jgi:ABC-type uncharacterized transport system substrate-binding protein
MKLTRTKQVGCKLQIFLAIILVVLSVFLSGSESFEADSGAVFSYIPNNIETGKLAAPMADKILKGTPAGTIMVVTPQSNLRVNYKLSGELGLNVSEEMLGVATEIIR